VAHDHERASASRGRLIAALAITATILVAEVIGSIVTGSLALLVDAGHMLTDTAGLAIAVTAASLVGRPASSRRTYGFARAEVLGAVAQAAILLVVGVIVIIEAIQRFSAPPELPGGALVIFGVIGLLGNVASLLVLASDRASSMNVRAAFLEVANDAIGSIAVIVAAIVIITTGFQLADVIAALAIGVLILPRAVLLLRDAAVVLLESTPSNLDLDSVREHLLEVEHVQAVHDLHVSQIATGLPVLTAHIVVDDECFYDGHAPRILDELQECVAEHFPVQIEHSTFQLELAAHGAHEHPTHD
jgi:cobalt-zinc-cadmium efflux system protein